MRLNGLTDKQIQQYLDDSLDAKERLEVEHMLAEGGTGAELLDDYGQLYGELSRCEVPGLSSSFADRVMESIADTVPALPKTHFIVHPAILLAALAAVSIVIYLVNPLNVLSLLNSFSLPDGWAIPDLATAVALLEIIQVKIANMNDLVPYLGVSASALICFTLLEHMLLAPQLKRI